MRRIGEIFLLILFINSCTLKSESPEVKQSLYDIFSVATIVKDFEGDSTIKEIKGIRTGRFFLYLEYSVYTGKKNRVLKGINKIENRNLGDLVAQSVSLSQKDQFYNDVIPEEKDSVTAFFWRFEELRNFEIYTCIKPPLRHYIIFDSNSDTVYHRIEELTD